MNSNRVKGMMDEVVGSAKRKVGELTDDAGLQVEGIVQQVKGDLENAWGKAIDIVRDANDEARVPHDTLIEVEMEYSAPRGESKKSK